MQAEQTRRTVLLAIGLVVLALVVGSLAMPPMMGYGMMWGYGTSYASDGWGWGWRMALNWLAMIVFWLAVIAAAVSLFRQTSVRPDAPADDPMTVLRRRYAAGEIDQETFARMRQELQRTAGGPS